MFHLFKVALQMNKYSFLIYQAQSCELSFRVLKYISHI